MASVRIYGYRGMIQVQQRMVLQYNADSVFLLEEPYVWRDILVLNGTNPIPSTPNNNADTSILRIEVPDNTQIRYEVCPNGPNAPTARLADANSPRISGDQIIPWGKGWSLSIIDAAGT